MTPASWLWHTLALDPSINAVRRAHQALAR
jgi:hypothetical protein